MTNQDSNQDSPSSKVNLPLAFFGGSGICSVKAPNDGPCEHQQNWPEQLNFNMRAIKHDDD